jgi:hypothetical protein
LGIARDQVELEAVAVEHVELAESRIGLRKDMLTLGVNGSDVHRAENRRIETSGAQRGSRFNLDRFRGLFRKRKRYDSLRVFVLRNQPSDAKRHRAALARAGAR